MKVVRIYSGGDGRSHFQDIEIELSDAGVFGRVSKLLRGPGVIFRTVEGDYDLDFHNAPRRQFVVNLRGSVEIVLGDGTARRFGPGEILLAEDLEGEGHRSRSVDGQPRTCLFVPVDDDVSL